jgi:hypothetical protein
MVIVVAAQKETTQTIFSMPLAVMVYLVPYICLNKAKNKYNMYHTLYCNAPHLFI